MLKMGEPSHICYRQILKMLSKSSFLGLFVGSNGSKKMQRKKDSFWSLLRLRRFVPLWTSGQPGGEIRRGRESMIHGELHGELRV